MIPDISEQGAALINRWLFEMHKCVESLSEIGLVQVQVSYRYNSVHLHFRTQALTYGVSLYLLEVESMARDAFQPELWLVRRTAQHVRQLRAMWQS